MSHSKLYMLGIGVVAASVLTVAVWAMQPPRETGRDSLAARENFDEQIQNNAKRMLEEGKKTFRFDTFGSEDFWGGKLRLHEALAGEKLGGVGKGVSPKAALGALHNRSVLHKYAGGCTRITAGVSFVSAHPVPTRRP